MSIKDFLGQQVKAPDTYTPEMLRTELRAVNREQYGIDATFFADKGYDIWNNWEVSFLLNNGTPVVGVAKIMFNANAINLVESKSLKLYFNSFNMQKLADTEVEARQKFIELAEKDLTAKSGLPVRVVFFKADEAIKSLRLLDGLQKQSILLDSVSIGATQVEHFNEAPHLLTTYQGAVEGEESYYGYILRSNCKVTHAPDTGDIYIRYATKDATRIDASSLLRYILSVRQESHFHEEILECIYKRLYDLLKPTKLLVAAFYNRRGSLDINPVRFSNAEDCASWIEELEGYSIKGFETVISKALRQ